MKKLLYPPFLILFLLSFLTGFGAYAQQSILDPNDPIVNYDPDNPPALPTSTGTLIKWVRTPQLSWNSSLYKAYLYKGSYSIMPFRLLFPKSYGTDPDKKYPLLIFFHGAGERSRNSYYDNELQLLHCSRKIMENVENGNFDGFVLYPQSLTSYWSSYTFSDLRNIIKYMIKYNHLDRSRITISGLSSGGSATWGFIESYPRLVAGATPISASGNWYENISVVDSLQSIPIWLSQGANDDHPYPNTSAHLVNYLRDHGLNVRYTVYPDHAHNVWDVHYDEPDAFSWMVKVNKTNPHVYYGQTEYCSGSTISDTLSLTSGFEAYQWSRNGQVIPGATSHKLIVTDTGTYAARYKEDGEWTYWSPDPVEITYRAFTQTPPITIKGLMSSVLPAPDGRTSVTLALPDGYKTYEWKNAAGQIIGTNSTYEASQAGNYVATVTALTGCPAKPSDSFYVAAADGPDAPDPATHLNGSALSQTTVQLYWSNNTNPANNETAFEIYRGRQEGGPYKLVNIVPADTLSYLDENLTPNKTYFYVVRAIDSTAAAPLSNEFRITTMVDKKPPTAPENLMVMGSTPTSVKLGWNASSDNVGVTRYGIYINGVRSYITLNTEFVVHNLTKDQSYAFTVKAFDTTGNISPASNQVIASAVQSGLNYRVYYYSGSWNQLPDLSRLTPADSGFLPNISLDPATQPTYYAMSFNGYISIKKPGTYTFYTQSDDGSNLYINNTQVVNNDGLHGSTEKSGHYTFDEPGAYSIRIDYYQEGGSAVLNASWAKSSAPGFSKSLIPDSVLTDAVHLAGNAPEKPLNITAQATSYDSVILNWQDNSMDETGFEIYRSKYSTGPFRIIFTTKKDSVSYTDTTVAPSTTYYYRLKAINQYGSSTFSVLNDNSRTTTEALPPAPAQPGSLTATPLSTDKIKLEWVDNATNETSFEVYRSDAAINKFRKLATLPANSTSYTDSSLYSNTQYSYKIKAVNIGGASAFSNEVSAMTLNHSPEIFLKNKYNIPLDTTSKIVVTATDKDKDLLILSATNLPGFATFIDNGDGSGTFTFSPSAGAPGNYTGLKILVVDQHGGKDSAVFNVSVVDAYPPVIQQIDTIYAHTFEYTSDTVRLKNGNLVQNIDWQTSGIPDFIETEASSNGKLALKISPGTDDAGYYSFKVIASNNYGMKDSTMVHLAVHSSPLKKWYLNFASDNSWMPFPSAPWNNIHGVSTTGLQDNLGNNSAVGLTLNTSWWNPTTTGKQTGDNSGVYPDNVLRDNYYFGRGGGPNTVTGKIMGLDPSKSYLLTFYSNSSWAFTNDNGHTVFRVGTRRDSLEVQGNTDKTVSFANVSPTTDGSISFTMSKGADAPAGYLNAIVISTLASIPPAVPTGLQLSNKIVNGGNAVELDWQLGSNNANTIKVYRSTSKSDNYILINDELANGSKESYTDTSVAPTTSKTYYYYLVASNAYGSSVSTDTLSITTNQYIDNRKWYLNFASDYSWMPLPSSPWNNIHGVTTTGLQDDQGHSSLVGLTLNTSWWNPTTTGKQTGDNSGIYPDDVLRDNYYFGRGDGPNVVTGEVNGLDPNKSYILTFFASSSWAFTNDNGHTVFQVGSQTDSIDVQGNTNNTLSFNNITPAQDGTISFTMSKGADAPAGYLNAIVISTQASIPPAVPTDLQLSNKVVNGGNAVEVNWQLGSNNANTIKVYRSTHKSSSYTLVNNGLFNGSKESYTDTSVAPTTSETYYYYLMASNAYGNSVSTDTVSITTNQYVDHRKWYLNFTSDYSWMPLPSSPWNNIHGVTTTGLQDDQGHSSLVGLTLNTSWWNPTTTGKQTGNNSGVYPDNVLRDNYYFGRGDGPNIVTGEITGLDANKSYILTFFASSSWAFTNDNGHTVFQVGSRKDSIDVQGNTDNVLSFNNITPAQDGSIHFTMSKGADAPAGYLNAIVISTQASDKPTVPVNLHLSNKIVNGENAVALNWQLGSNNANAIKIYRATHRKGSYDLLNAGIANGNEENYTDTSVAPTTSATYYYYLVASNAYGQSLATDTVSITTSQYVDNREWYLNFATSYGWMSFPGSPWNNIHGVATTDLQDNQGHNSLVGLTLNTDWWNPTTTGAQTGNNSGVYPDDVLRDNYYFGRGDGPNVVTGEITGLDPNKSYILTFFASSIWAFTNDNGHTVFQIANQKDSIDVQGNINNTLSFNHITPAQNGTISFTMSKGADALAGYLNALIIRTESDIAPHVPINFQLANTIAQSENAVKVSWQLGSNNTMAVYLYRSSNKTGPYSQINSGQTGIDSTSFIDSDVAPLNAATYYYYMVASNEYGSSVSTDTLSITTPILFPVKPSHLSLTKKSIDNNYAVQLNWNLESDYVKEVDIYRSNQEEGSYTLLNSLMTDGTATGYMDVNVELGGSYYYYLIAKNDFGTSVPSDTASITLPGTPPPLPPVLTDIPETYVAADSVVSIPVYVAASGESISFSLHDAPSFVSLQNTDTHTAKLLVEPEISDKGDYDSLRVVATNTLGDADTLYFDLHVIDGALLPATPANFNAAKVVVNNEYGINLNWQLRSVNNEKVNVYRSTQEGNGYALLASFSTTSGTTQYLDTNVTLGTTYYYYLTGKNEYGNSESTDTLSVSIPNVPLTPPVLSALPETYVSAGNVDTLQVSNLAPDGTVTFSLNNVPAFVFLQAIDANNAQLIIQPNHSDIGSYDSLEVVATKAEGSTDTAYFSLYVTDGNLLPDIYLNFTNAGNDYSQPWNNIVFRSLSNVDYGNLVNSDNQPTGITLTVVNPWTSTQTNGANTYNNSGVVPDSVMATGYYIDNSNVQSLKISGLDENRKYNLVFFGSSNEGGNTNYTTDYTVDEQTVSLNGIRNTSKAVRINGLVPKQDGTITITVAKDASAAEGLLNALIIEPHASDGLVAPAQLKAVAEAGKVHLSWVDRSDNEQKFMILRSSSLNGTYAEVGQVNANTTSFEDGSVAADIRYFYKVVAVSAEGTELPSEVASVTTPQFEVYVNFSFRESPAAAPWNNTLTPPQDGDVYGPLHDSKGNNSAIILDMVSNFKMEKTHGVNTGDNSGIYPDLVMSGSCYANQGVDTVVMKVSNLNLSMKYDLTFFGSLIGEGWKNTTQYIVNDQKVALEVSYNSTNTVTLHHLSPNMDGQIVVRIINTKESSYMVLNAMVLKCYDNYDNQGNKVIDSSLYLRVSNDWDSDANSYLSNDKNKVEVNDFQVIGSAYPNPFHQVVHIDLNSPITGKVMLNLYDVKGRLVDKRIKPLVKGRNNLEYYPVQKLQPGIYILSLRLIGTKNMINLKLVKP